MILGIMQPYFFPYIGYFALMRATERWIVFDTPQYIRKGWVNRNRVLSNGQRGWKYIHVPIVKCPMDTPINAVMIDPRDNWRETLFRNLDYYYDRRAPYYRQTMDFLDGVLALDQPRLSKMLSYTLKATCEYLGVEVQMQEFSAMELLLGEIRHPGDWAFEISRVVGASVYINPLGGRDLFCAERFQKAGIDLKIFKPVLLPYDQRRKSFVEGLSIIDALMWKPREEVRSMLDAYDFLL